MTHSFIIHQKLPSLNDYIKSCRTNKYAGAKFKREVEQDIGWYIKVAKMGKISPPVVVHFEWHEGNRRDADNIASAKKFILDALVSHNILQDDGRRYVKGFTDTFITDKKEFVVVKLEEIEG